MILQHIILFNTPLVFTLHLPAHIYVLLAVAFVAAICAIAGTWSMIVRVLRHKRRCDAYEPDPAEEMPPVSIIIYSQDNSENLTTLLPALLNQNYNGKTEIIVVNDGESASVHRVVSALQVAHPNVYLTHTPDEARNLSRKKLAITLGVKAARYGITLHTNACCSPAEGDDSWLHRMARHFLDDDTDVVLGYATPDFQAIGKHTRTLCFDYVADAIPWLSAAVCRHPYMGTSCNLAYRCEVFFNNKGFSKSLRLNNGDDDIFVNEITNSQNTAVEISSVSILRTNFYSPKEYIEQERQTHVFTGRFVSHAWRRKASLYILCMWVALICAAAAVALLPLNLAVIASAIVIAACAIVWPTVYWSKIIRALHGRRLRFSLPWTIFMRPLRNLALKLRATSGKNKNYTWN